MSHRFLVYPLLFVILTQVMPLVRDDPRWFIGPIIQRLVILFACAMGLGNTHYNFWIATAWGLTVWLVVLPKIAIQSAQGWLISGELERAATAWRGVAWYTWGRSARLYRTFATALHLWSIGQEPAAEAMLKQLDDPTLPDSVRGELHLWRLYLLTANREWQRVIDLYESAFAWGQLPTALEARLVAARAYAELGQLLRAIQCLHFVDTSPRVIGALEKQLRMTRICVAALAGARDELESLLAAKTGFLRQRGLARFAAVWRGRCAAARGDREEAGRQFARALALTPVTLPKSRAIIDGYLKHLNGDPMSPTPLAGEFSQPGFALLREADAQMAPWRALMNWGQPPIVTSILLALLGVVFMVDEGLSHLKEPHRLWEWGGNVPLKEIAGQWWRPVTALFLHANWLHLVMNGGALWMFGAAIEKTYGWVRLLLIFLVAGTVANVISAALGGFDVSVGASGAIFGLVAAFGVAVYRLKSAVPPSVRRRLLNVLGLMLVVDLTIGGLETQIDNAAHIGGFVVGLFLALLTRPREDSAGTEIEQKVTKETKS